MNYEKLSKFVRTNGTVKVFSSGNERILKSGDPDLFELVEKSERFEFQGSFYTKIQFEAIVDDSK